MPRAGARRAKLEVGWFNGREPDERRAFVAEAGVKHRGWTIFGRAEMTENRELIELEGEEEHGPAFKVGKASLGALRDFRIAKNLTLGAGGLVSLNFVPRGLRAEYVGSNPMGAMAFQRVKLD